MHLILSRRKRFSIVSGLAIGAALAIELSAQSPPGSEADMHSVTLLSVQGKVEIVRGGRKIAPAPPQPLLIGDRLETGPNSQASLRWYDRMVFQIDELGLIEIPPPSQPKKKSGLNLLKGLFYFFHRDRPKEFELRTPTSMAVVLGTEFAVRVDEKGRTVLSVLEGEVEMSNAQGKVSLRSGEEGVTEEGQPPRSSAIETDNDLIQWFLYYPAVLDPDELGLRFAERQELRGSLLAYRSGDVLGALAQYPAGRAPASEEEKIYLAGLLLAAGQVDQAQSWLESVASIGTAGDRVSQLGAALSRLIASVKLESGSVSADDGLASGALAESYYLQSVGDLEGARVAAGLAARRSSNFGFAWVRLAELEFGFGRTDLARAALAKGLAYSPRHAPGQVLRGFLLVAENRVGEALEAFDRAIALDGGLANAWLGRGLCRIRAGQSEAGRLDLEVAAAMEPQRAVLRSYLGKAFSQTGERELARHELELAKQLDPRDPTSWLYSALLLEEGNRINQAVRELEKSQALNENRRVYRSQVLLDRDRAVRGANLARIYQDAGLEDVSRREAVRAVAADYGNYSAHLFLANTYNQLRDPGQVNLRFETPWLSEYLLANLLAPVGAGVLSQTVSEGEYSRLFERDRFGLVSSTEYLSRGDWIQGAAQYGIYGNSAYALDMLYRSDNGQRLNNDLEQLSLSFQFKQQLSPADSVFLQAIYYDAEAGDRSQHYDPTQAQAGLRVEETQDPLLLAGYHHEWQPGVHTLVLGSRLEDRLSVGNPRNNLLILTADDTDLITTADILPHPLDYKSELKIYSAELQQIWQQERGALIVGMRYQTGDFETRNQIPAFPLFVPATDTNVVSDFDRFSAYGYYHWQVAESLVLIGGVSYDRVEYPVNFRSPPVAGGEDRRDQVSPKVGFVWTPGTTTTVRGAYTKSLGGVSFDQSFQLEPSQVAGFTQSYRSLIPESVAGGLAVPSFETWGLALDQKFVTGTYLGLSGEWLESDVDPKAGAFVQREVVVGPGLTQFISSPSSVKERYDYRERTLRVIVNQLLGEAWSLGGSYRLSQAELEHSHESIPETATPFGGFSREDDFEATLHQVHLAAFYTHRCGFFSQLDCLWSKQINHGYGGAFPGDDFWQFNLYAGYRFSGRRAELRLGLLNVTDQDYRLNPLNLTRELPRDRTLAVRFRFQF